MYAYVCVFFCLSIFVYLCMIYIRTHTNTTDSACKWVRIEVYAKMNRNRVRLCFFVYAIDVGSIGSKNAIGSAAWAGPKIENLTRVIVMSRFRSTDMSYSGQI